MVSFLIAWLFTLVATTQGTAQGTAQVEDLPVVRLLERDYYRYEVKKSETLFSLSRRFEVTQEALIEANPSLKDGLKAGQQLLIPIASKKETEVVENKPENKPEKLPRFSLLLPFNPTETSAVNERYLEFYEGFLLGIDTLKALGYSFEVQTLDVGTDAAGIERCIKNGELDQTDYCLGGINAAQIAVLSKWAATNKKTTILPFSSRIPEMATNSYLYQPLTNQEYMLGRLASYLSIRFAGVDYILLKDRSNAVSSKSESLTEALKAQFTKTGTKYREVYPDETLDTLVNSLSNIHETVIVPYPMNQNDATRFVTTLAAASALKPEKNITLLGYPDWQAMNKRTIQLFHTLNTHIYSSFFANFQDETVAHFQLTFNATFGKSLLNTYPKYGIMGYDIATYFIPRMVNVRKGQTVTNRPNSLQQAFQFQPLSSGSGSYNQLFYLIHYTKDNQLDIKQIR